MASFKAKFPVLQELFAKNHRGGGLFGLPPAGRGTFVDNCSVFSAQLIINGICNRCSDFAVKIWFSNIFITTVSQFSKLDPLCF